MKIVRLSDLLGIDDAADPYFVNVKRCPSYLEVDQALEVDRIDQGPFAVGGFADLYGFFDEGQSRTRA